MKKMSKWHWALVGMTAIIVIGVLSGPTGVVDKYKTPEVAKVVTPDSDQTDLIVPLSFQFPNLNAKVEMRCIDPSTTHSGFSWNVSSLDKKNPPPATKIFFNFAKSKRDPLVASGWRGIQSPNDKLPMGDAFMLTAIQLKDAGSQSYNHYVFAVANSLETVRNVSQEDVVYVPVGVVSMISTTTMASNPCSTLQTN